MELSLDGKYLVIACGSPQYRAIFLNVEERRVMGGSQSFINLKGRSDDLLKLSFNPTNRKQIAAIFRNRVEIYEIKDCLEMK